MISAGPHGASRSVVDTTCFGRPFSAVAITSSGSVTFGHASENAS